MSSFNLALSVVCPLILMLMIGYFLRMIKVFNADFLKQLNNLCFKVFLPVLLFLNVYNSDFSTDFSWQLLIFALIAVIAIFVILLIVVPILCKDNLRRGVYIQGILRSNFILFGLPTTIAIFGAENVGPVSILISFIVPLYNLLSVVALNIYTKDKISVKNMLKGVILNPLILASLIGFLFVITGIKMPDIMSGAVENVSYIATPLAFIVLGGSFNLSSIKKNIWQLIVCMSAKLVVLPLIIVPIAIALNFSPIFVVAVFAMSAAPTAVSTYSMAQSLNKDSELAGQIVVFTSIFSIFTIFVGVMMLSVFGII